MPLLPIIIALLVIGILLWLISKAFGLFAYLSTIKI